MRRRKKMKDRLRTFNQKPDRLPVPKKLQDIIPVRTIYPDGTFEVTKGRYTKTFAFTDINYNAAGLEQKKSYALKYEELLNSIDEEAVVKITVNRRKMNMPEFKENVLLKPGNDGLDRFRDEYNRILTEAAQDTNSIIKELYITVSVERPTYEAAKTFFNRVENDFGTALHRIGSSLRALDAAERCHIIYDFYRAGEEADYHFDLKDMMKYGRDFKTYICPDSLELKSDCFKIGKRYGRVIILRETASYLKDNILFRIMDTYNTSMMSFDIIPVPKDVAVADVSRRLLGAGKNISDWQQRQQKHGLPALDIPYELEQQREEIKEFLDDLVNRDQKMFYVTMTLVHTADTLEELDHDSSAIMTAARKALCQMSVLNYQQLDGLNTVLPWGLRCIDFTRTMTTEAMLAFTPFYVQEVHDTKGNYYGKNRISKSIILADKTGFQNANMFILAVPGAGKSMLGKNELAYNILSDPDTDVIVIDPEREYTAIVKALGGEIIKISASSESHINLMDINREYAMDEKESPIVLKCEFIMSVCEQIAGRSLSAGEKSIIDRCVRAVYKKYLADGYAGEPPTLTDLYNELLKCPEPEAGDLALALELFVNGSLNTFNSLTNVDVDNRLLSYDLLDMGEQLRPVGMLAVLDNILNRVTRNRFKGRKTVIIIEEIYLFLMYMFSAVFFYKMWKRIRKYNGYCVGITQNVSDLRQSDTARAMLSNSEFIFMLNQAADDRADLASLLHISPEQLQYITNVPEGCGLMKLGNSLIPFENLIPKDTELYRMMTSKPGEAV